MVCDNRRRVNVSATHEPLSGAKGPAGKTLEDQPEGVCNPFFFLSVLFCMTVFV